jgi:hypothetical protein
VSSKVTKLLVGVWLVICTSRHVLYLYTWLRPYPSTDTIVASIERSAASWRAAAGIAPSDPAGPIR